MENSSRLLFFKSMGFKAWDPWIYWYKFGGDIPESSLPFFRYGTYFPDRYSPYILVQVEQEYFLSGIANYPYDRFYNHKDSELAFAIFLKSQKQKTNYKVLGGGFFRIPSSNDIIIEGRSPFHGAEPKELTKKIIEEEGKKCQILICP